MYGKLFIVGQLHDGDKELIEAAWNEYISQWITPNNNVVKSWELRKFEGRGGCYKIYSIETHDDASEFEGEYLISKCSNCGHFDIWHGYEEFGYKCYGNGGECGVEVEALTSRGLENSHRRMRKEASAR